ncbi:MAG: Gfo/Idh/MocA family protein, partial [Candidatus Bathyarchaeia archaeon]
MDEMKSLKLAVVGTGFWGRNHVRVFNELPETEVVAVCDTDPERARAVAEEYGIKFYTDSQIMFKRENIDAVTICVWSANLAEEAVKALKAGKHLLVEKPMASSSSEARRILELAKEKERRLAVGFIER